MRSCRSCGAGVAAERLYLHVLEAVYAIPCIRFQKLVPFLTPSSVCCLPILAKSIQSIIIHVLCSMNERSRIVILRAARREKGPPGTRKRE